MQDGRRGTLLFGLLGIALMVIVAPDRGLAQNSGTDKAIAHIDLQQFSNAQWDVSARSNFNGTQPSGSWRFTNQNADPNFVFSGEITCLQVIPGGTALATGIVTSVRGTTANFNAVWFSMTDAGKFSTTTDLFGATFVTLTQEQFGVCPIPTAIFQQPVLDGEVIVQDATH